MTGQNDRDELDLLQLFLRLVNIVRANFWMIIAFFVVGSALGAMYFFSARKVYENNMIISSGIMTESYSKVIFNNVNKHLREGDVKVVSEQLHISESTADKILKFSIETFSNIQTGPSKENDRFLITAELTDQTILSELQKGLVTFIENNPYVKVRVQQSRSTLEQTLKEIDTELKDLESFKSRISTGEFFQDIKGSLMFDPTVVNSKILELKERKIDLTHRLELVNSVQVIEGFTKFEKHTKPQLSLSLMAGSVVGLIFVALLIAFKSIRKIMTLADEVKR